MTLLTSARAWLAAQTTERTVLGLKLLAVLLAVWLVMLLGDRAHAARQAARVAEARLAAIVDTADMDTWAARAAEARRVRAAWTEAGWSATTPGVAAARIQTELEAMARTAGVESLNATVSPDPLAVDGREVLEFDFSIRGDEVAVLQLLSALSLHEPRLIPASVNARLDGRRTALRVAGFAPYRKAAAKTDTADATD
ncbi:hypothetical protein EV659_10858 [Rhodothalassium salexigens DSM 2132]|uniref:Type II secretion system (T2SS) protein M subtype b n=1 Tax=Rhodothalassium salexigens DSM 2132 TaxID=1188247 RepID=A0A4R2PCR2_RHOSA|nr:hypothetical protein [Rhodothalassium salexigens]MBB4212084.1 hypothetical protein [Rhodothalassium salexigens DSM 2132]MBK1638301.1 hypothetical protein [Rhodothalassium salexigens DSM 2132]TCP32959.1 hypothetical protein EV659_10858 [Rhodothalassium salexigens DSM 2132]